MKSLKQIIDEANIKPNKLKEFGIDFPNMEQFIDVSLMPNSMLFKTMPTIFTCDGDEIFEFKRTEQHDMLQSSPRKIIHSNDDDAVHTLLESEMLSEDNDQLWSEVLEEEEQVINSTWQTTQHILSHDDILESEFWLD